MYGAKRLSRTATASAASRTAGSAPPGPESMALRVALTSSISLATTTLNLLAFISSAASATARWVMERSSRSPEAGSAPGALVTSAPRRQARARNFAEPDGETSAQSTSSSGGEANTMVRRMASTPYRSSCSLRSTPLPSDLLIAFPPLSTWPWFRSAAKGSVKPTIPMSYRTLVKNLLYSRCRIACSTPPTYWPTGSQLLTASVSKGAVSRSGERKRR